MTKNTQTNYLFSREITAAEVSRSVLNERSARNITHMQYEESSNDHITLEPSDVV